MPKVSIEDLQTKITQLEAQLEAQTEEKFEMEEYASSLEDQLAVRNKLLQIISDELTVLEY